MFGIMPTTSRITSKHLCARFVVAGLLALFMVAGVAVVPAMAAPEASAAAAPAQSGIYYTVQRSDTLTSIARRYGTTVYAIARANGIVNPSRIYVGQRLWIPGAHHVAPPVHTRIHIVQRTDNLSSIARHYNTTVQAIMRANGLTNPNYIFIGQRLHVPVGTWSPPSVYGFYYTVRAGDNLSRIAQRYGVSVHTLARVNNIHNIHRIYVGQKIYIP
jgi:LysM repeat protein